MTMITIITLCSVLGTSPVEEPKEAPVLIPEQVQETVEFREVSKRHHLFLSTGYSEIRSKEIYWFGGKERPVVAVDYIYGDDALYPGFAVGASLAHEQGEGDFDLALTELSLDAFYQWPNEGWGGIVFPYAKISALAAMVNVQSNTSSKWVDSNFVPGLSGALGARIGFGRLAPTDRIHWMATVEWGYALRQTTLIRLRPSDEEVDIEPIRIGDINLSGMAFKVGIGFEF